MKHRATGYEALRCDELGTVLSLSARVGLFAGVEQVSYTKHPPFFLYNTSQPLPCSSLP